MFQIIGVKLAIKPIIEQKKRVFYPFFCPKFSKHVVFVKNISNDKGNLNEARQTNFDMMNQWFDVGGTQE